MVPYSLGTHPIDQAVELEGSRKRLHVESLENVGESVDEFRITIISEEAYIFEVIAGF